MNITNEVVTDYLNKFYKPKNKCLEDLRRVGEEENVPIILKETEAFLGTFLSIVKPSNILEIGTAIGYSSIFFASVCENATITTIEKNEDLYDTSQANINCSKLSDRIKVKLGDGEEVILNDIGSDEIFDLVFIDAAKSHYQRFLDAAMPHLKPGSVIICDNVLFKARTASSEYDSNNKYKTTIRKMREFLDYISNSEILDTVIVSCGDGLSISVYRGNNEK